MTIEQSIAAIRARTAELQAATASFCARVDSWLAGAPTNSATTELKGAMAGEVFLLPSWKRKPRSWHALPSGELIQYGVGRAHSVHTRTFIRYTPAIVDYLRQVIECHRVITAEQAEAILRTIKPNNTAYSKRDPVQAEPDVLDPTWRQRSERLLTPEQLIREQFADSPRQLERELRRIQ